jgi:hypothetical protein
MPRSEENWQMALATIARGKTARMEIAVPLFTAKPLFHHPTLFCSATTKPGYWRLVPLSRKTRVLPERAQRCRRMEKKKETAVETRETLSQSYTPGREPGRQRALPVAERNTRRTTGFYREKPLN